MKVLHVNAFLLMPDNASGDVVAALRELLRFLEAANEGMEELPHTACFSTAPFSGFDHNRKLGLRLSASKVGVYELVDGRSWRKLAWLRLPPRCHVDGDCLLK